MSVALFHTCVCLFGDLRWLYFFAGGEPSEDCVRQRNPSGLCAVWKTPAGGDHKNGSVSLPLVSINLHHSPPVPPFFTSLPQSLTVSLSLCQSPSVSISAGVHVTHQLITSLLAVLPGLPRFGAPPPPS